MPCSSWELASAKLSIAYHYPGFKAGRVVIWFSTLLSLELSETHEKWIASLSWNFNISRKMWAPTNKRQRQNMNNNLEENNYSHRSQNFAVKILWIFSSWAHTVCKIRYHTRLTYVQTCEILHFFSQNSFTWYQRYFKAVTNPHNIRILSDREVFSLLCTLNVSSHLGQRNQ